MKAKDAIGRVVLLSGLGFALGLGPGCKKGPPSEANRPPAETAATVGADGRVEVTVGADGYHPSTVRTTPGRPVTLVFTRTTEESCGQQVVFPSLEIRRDLPLRQPVEVTVTPTAGTLAFTCGMGMLRGAVVAQ
jgi:plastocyanin domain-containing protein